MAINTRCKASWFSVDLVVEITRSTASQTVPIAPWIASIDPGDTRIIYQLSLSWNGICGTYDTNPPGDNSQVFLIHHS
jgi:hypothetical protein